MEHRNRYYAQVQLLVRILPIISQETCFALKGGTALNLFVRNLPRLSVDIDLTYLPIQNRDESLQEIKKSLENIAAAIQTIIPDTKILSDKSSKLLVRQAETQIKVEVNEVIRGSVHPINLLSVNSRTEDEFGFAEMQVLSIEDLYAGKICAALDRQHPRDLFDIKYFLEHHEVNCSLLETFIVYLISHNRPINEVLAPNLRDITSEFQNEFEAMSDESVTLKELETARSELIARIHKSLSDKHKKFLISFKSMQPDWNLLELQGIDNLPAVKWKLLNLEKMSKQKHHEDLQALKNQLGKITGSIVVD